MTERRKPGRKRGEAAQAERVLTLVDELQARRAYVPLHVLAEKLAVSERQLRRDLDVLVGRGYAIDLDVVDRRTAVRLTRSVRKDEPNEPGVRERISLALVSRVFSTLQGTPFAMDVQRVIRRLFRDKTSDERQTATFQRQATYIADGGTKVYDRRARDAMDELLSGLVYRLRVDATYRTATHKKKDDIFEPWGVALYRHGVYFVGRFANGQHERYVLPLERFVSCKRRRGDHFELPPGFDVAKVFENAIGVVVGAAPVDVVLELSAQVAHLVEVRRFHPSQRTTPLDDGRVRLTMRVANTPDLLSSILAWGEHVRVVEPPELRAKVRETLERALAQA